MRVRVASVAVSILLAGVAMPAFAQSVASNFTSAARYDIERRVVGTIAPDPDGTGVITFAAVRNSYDARGLLIKVENGELAAWQPETITPAAWTGFTIFQTVDTLYDLSGRKIRTTVSAGGVIKQVTQFSYDGLDRLVCTAVRMNPDTYNALPADACALSTVSATYGADRITRTIYDAAGRVAKIQKAVGTSLQQDYASYSYTLNGKLQSMADANGTTAKMTWDALDRQARWYFPSKTSAGVASAVDYEEYGYDNAGNRTSLRKRDGRTLTFAYDALNRVISKSVPEGGCAMPYSCATLPASATRDVFYGYDLRNLARLARFDSLNGEGVESVYDSAGRMVASNTTMGGVSRSLTYLVDKDGNRLRVTHPDGNYFTYSYDKLDRMLQLRELGVSTLAANVYNPQGARKSTSRVGASIAYGYDTLVRLTSLTNNLAGTSGDLSFGFGYNPASQITTRTRSNDAFVYGGDVNVSRLYSVNGLNQYLSAGPASFSYDSNGNLTSDGSVNYGFDAENRLISASGARSAALVYDPLGRLHSTSGGSAGETRFLYDGDELIAEYDGAGTLLRRYVHGPLADDPMVWYEGPSVAAAARRQMFTDHQGSVVAVADSVGALLRANSYDDWGTPGATNLGRFGYTGQAWIPEIGLFHYKARAYSPTLGRFLQTDPVGYDDQVNLYAYVANDPVNATDPTGEACTKEDSSTCDAPDTVVTGQDSHPVPAGTTVTHGDDDPAKRKPRPESSDCGRAGCQTKPLPDCMRAFLKRYYPKSNVDAVRIHNGSPFGLTGNSVTFGHTINLAGGRAFYNPVGYARHIFHEFTHVRQYEAGTLSVGGYIADAAYYMDHDSIPTEAQAIANSAVLADVFADSPEAKTCGR